MYFHVLLNVDHTLPTTMSVLSSSSFSSSSSLGQLLSKSWRTEQRRVLLSPKASGHQEKDETDWQRQQQQQ
ncbi:hypothetical protein M0802_007176 [Mischocyttarus mexicanus]|nr:hypothetical protein M0802_007176 [Mischocyttarus mexicanus]